MAMWHWKIGTVVREVSGSCSGLTTRNMYGHVIGFSNNGIETILKVQWDDGIVRGIHPSNVECQ